MSRATTESKSLVTTQAGLEKVQAELRSRGLDGWLLYDFKDRNPIARALLDIDWTTRRAFALIPAEGTPRLLIHAIEHSSWRHLDWPKTSYSSWQEMETGIAALLAGCGQVATETSTRSRVGSSTAAGAP